MTSTTPFTLGNYHIIPAEFTIQLAGNDKQSLQPKFIEVLCYLAKHYPRVIPRDELIDNIWGENSYVGDKSLTNAIWHLRKHLVKTEDGQIIETIRKAGYRLLIEPQWQPSTQSLLDEQPIQPDTIAHRNTNASHTQEVEKKAINKPWSFASKVVAASILLIMLITLDYIFHSPQAPKGTQISQITQHPGSELFPAPSPDGRYVVYSQLSGSKPRNLFLKDTFQPQLPPKQLTFDQATQGHSVWSNDGQYLYFSRKDEINRSCQYMQLKVESNQEKVIANCPMRGIYYYLDISPDDNTLAVYNFDHSAEDTGIYFIDLSSETYAMTRFSCQSNCTGKDRDMAFSPDGQHIAISRRADRFNENIFLVNLRNQESVQLTIDEEDIVGLSWHPDGKKMVYGAIRADIRHGFVLDIASKTTQELNLAGFSYPSFAKKSKQLFYQQRHEKESIVSLTLNTDIASTPFPIVDSNFSHSSPDYSAQSKRIAYISNESGFFELWTANIDGSDRKQLTQLKQTVRYPKWSHQGDKIAFLAPVPGEEGDSIYIYSMQNQKVSLLSTPFDKHNRPSWSFDDSKVLSAIYTNEFTDIYSISLKDNTLKRLTFDSGRYGQMIAPQTLLYTKLKRGLWQKDLSTTDEATLVINGDYFTTRYAWVFHHDTVYFHKAFQDHQQLIAYQLENQVNTPLVRLPTNSISKNGMLGYIAAQDTLLFTGDSYPQANIQMIESSALLLE